VTGSGLDPVDAAPFSPSSSRPTPWHESFATKGTKGRPAAAGRSGKDAWAKPKTSTGGIFEKMICGWGAAAVGAEVVSRGSGTGRNQAGMDVRLKDETIASRGRRRVWGRECWIERQRLALSALYWKREQE
jgi:hypothetical protein